MSKSMLEEFELWAAMEREADKDVEEELLMYKKEVME